MRTRKLEDGYVFEDKREVLRFVKKNRYLLSILEEALDIIPKYFAKEELLLEVMQDPEEDWVDLALSIQTELDVDKAMEKLDKMDDEWWLSNIQKAKGKLCIRLDFV